MSGYLRTGISRKINILEHLREELIFAQNAPLTRQDLSCEAFMAKQDPFLVDDPCSDNVEGLHDPVASCGEVVCRHCAKVF